MCKKCFFHGILIQSEIGVIILTLPYFFPLLANLPVKCFESNSLFNTSGFVSPQPRSTISSHTASAFFAIGLERFFRKPPKELFLDEAHPFLASGNQLG